jgi:hypothetical protein
MIKTFKNAFELAAWIKANIKDDQQEFLMLEGVRNSYTIRIKG